MVGMATKVNSNRINKSGIGGKETHKKPGVTVYRKMSMNGDRNYIGAAEKISGH